MKTLIYFLIQQSSGISRKQIRSQAYNILKFDKFFGKKLKIQKLNCLLLPNIFHLYFKHLKWAYACSGPFFSLITKKKKIITIFHMENYVIAFLEVSDHSALYIVLFCTFSIYTIALFNILMNCRIYMMMIFSTSESIRRNNDDIR